MDWSAPNRAGVKLVQSWLASLGHEITVDGKWGPRTEAAFRVSSGFRGSIEADAAKVGHGFTGTLDFLHREESHAGRPYWPGKISGVTLDPGVDLGYVDPALVLQVYGEAIFDRCRKAFGVRGAPAKQLAKSPPVSEIRITRDQARRALPEVARPYWIQISARFPRLTSAPAPVQEACLSLAYNRGYGNRHLEVMRSPIAAGDWSSLADAVARMQQDRDDGIPARRKREAALIRSAA